MNCQHCGASLPSESRFCTRCGQPVGDQDPVAPHEAELTGPHQASSAPQGTDTQGSSAFSQMDGHGLGQPSYAPTVLVSLFFGLFGLIPAVRHSRMARERGYSERGYWWAFGSIVGVEALASILLPLVLVTALTASVNNMNSSLTAPSRPNPSPASSPSNGSSSGSTSVCQGLQAFDQAHAETVAFVIQHRQLILALEDPTNQAALNAYNKNPSPQNVDALVAALGPVLMNQLVQYESNIVELVVPYNNEIRVLLNTNCPTS